MGPVLGKEINDGSKKKKGGIERKLKTDRLR